MNTTSRSIQDTGGRARPTPRTSDAALLGDDQHGLGGVLGSLAGAMDELRGIEPGEGSLLDRDQPIGSARSHAGGAARDSGQLAAGARFPDAGTRPHARGDGRE